MKKKQKTALFCCMGVLAAALIGTTVYYLGNNNKTTVAFAKEKVVRGNIDNTITATGTIEPVTEVTVGTQVSGIIDKIYIDYNSPVKKGQLIAEMDKVNLTNELQSAQALYTGAEAEYNYQRGLYNRNKALYAKQLISATDYELSRYNFQKAQSSYTQAKASLAKAQRNLSYATITSPIDGVVTGRNVEEGQTVAAGYSTPTLFTIAADLTKMQVVADVDEADIADVQPGNRVTFTVDAYPDDTFEGKVTQVRLGSSSSSSSSTTSTSSESVVTYEVVISADNSSLKLRPRLTANVTIHTTHRENVVVVPNKALRFEPNTALTGTKKVADVQAEHKVWIEQRGRLQAVAVQVGLADATHTEIISGLSVGQQVLVGTQSATAATADTSQNSNTSSPFMPTPPGKKNK